MNLYSIYDSKAEAFAIPFACPNDGVAKRMLIDTVKGGGTSLSNHPEDFSLFKIASYEETTGVVTPDTPLSCLGTVIVLCSSLYNGSSNGNTNDVEPIDTKAALAEYEEQKNEKVN